MADPTSFNHDNAKAVYQSLLSNGIRGNVAQAIVINGIYESNCDPNAEELGGTGRGIWQWSFGQASNIVSRGLMGNVDGQVKYLIENDPDQWLNVAIKTPWDNFADFLKSDYSVADLDKFFCANWERAASGPQSKRIANAERDADLIKDVLGDPSNAKPGGNTPNPPSQGGGGTNPNKPDRSSKYFYQVDDQTYKHGSMVFKKIRSNVWALTENATPAKKPSGGGSGGGSGSGGGTSQTTDVAGKIAWLDSQVGKLVGYQSTGSYGQCYGLVQAYSDELGNPNKLIGGVNASDIGTDYPWESWGWHIQLNPSLGDIQPGDIVCVAPNKYSPTYGHVVIAGQNGSYYDQNKSGNSDPVTHEASLSHILTYATFTSRIWK